MLLGEYKQAVDRNGQTYLPNRVMGELDDDFVLTRGFEKNLLLYSLAEWRKLADKLLAKPISGHDIRALRRRLFSAAVKVTPEPNGRFVIPQSLLDYAGIDDEVVMAGLFDHLELWSIENWLPVLADAEADGGDRWDELAI